MQKRLKTMSVNFKWDMYAVNEISSAGMSIRKIGPLDKYVPATSAA